MSGYLQRLVSSTRTPGAAVRPLLGSLYSNSPHPETAEAFHALEETVLARQPEFPATPESQSVQGIQPSSELRGASREDSNSEPQLQISQARVFRTSDAALPVKEESATSGVPLGPKPIPDTLFESPANPEPQAQPYFTPLANEIPQDRRAALDASGKSELAAKPFEGEQQGRPAIRKQVYAPLVREGLRTAEERAFQNPRPSASDRRRTEPVRPAARPAARPEREGEEIQIHIGRIEVTAVPPAPPRPAAQPVRKSLRLDEYLRRGRARGL